MAGGGKGWRVWCGVALWVVCVSLKRCKVWAKIDEERRQATTVEERAAVSQEKKNHIQAIMADRAVSVRTNRVAEEHSKVPSVDGINQLLKITIDGMDQAKFRCPPGLGLFG